MRVNIRLYINACFINFSRIHHYNIERQRDGTVRIPRGWSFMGPVELVTHHKLYRDGLVTKPAVPCERPEGTAPMAWPGVTSLELEHALLEEAERQKLTVIT